MTETAAKITNKISPFRRVGEITNDKMAAIYAQAIIDNAQIIQDGLARRPDLVSPFEAGRSVFFAKLHSIKTAAEVLLALQDKTMSEVVEGYRELAITRAKGLNDLLSLAEADNFNDRNLAILMSASRLLAESISDYFRTKEADAC